MGRRICRRTEIGGNGLYAFSVFDVEKVITANVFKEIRHLYSSRSSGAVDD